MKCRDRISAFWFSYVICSLFFSHCGDVNTHETQGKTTQETQNNMC